MLDYFSISVTELKESLQKEIVIEKFNMDNGEWGFSLFWIDNRVCYLVQSFEAI